MRADGYDPVAEQYVAKFVDELQHKPFDREWLRDLAGVAHGPVCDLGCGPGHAARFLQDCGARAFGIDGSSSMVRAARRAHPSTEYIQADMRALPLASESLDAIVALYSLIHITPEDLTATILEWRRVLAPGGMLLVSYHVGDEQVHFDDWMDEKVDLDFYFMKTNAVTSLLEESGFKIEKACERPPYEPYEYPTTRGYVIASNV